MSDVQDDLSALSSRALGVFKKYRGCQGNYKTLAPDARRFANSLEDVEDAVLSHTLNPACERELRASVMECNQLLAELEMGLKQFYELGPQARRSWDLSEESKERESVLRAQLESKTTQLTTLHEKLIQSDQTHVQEALNRLLKDYQYGNRDAATVVTLCTATETKDEAAAWTQIVKELGDLGVSKPIATEYRSFIADWCMNTMEQGLLFERRDPDEHHQLAIATSRLSVADSGMQTSAAMRQRSSSSASIPRKPVSSGLIPVASLSPRARSPPTPTASFPNPLRSPAQFQGQNPQQATTDQGALQSSRYPFQMPPIPQQPLMHYPITTALPVQPQYEQPQAVPLASTEQFRAPLQVTHSHSQQPIARPPTTRNSSISVPESRNDETNIMWTAQRIVRHWNDREWKEAEKYLGLQLSAVLAGEKIVIRDVPTQPDARVLQHLLGCCASFQGKFRQAKKLFEAVNHTPFTGGGGLDDGDIASAVWLGDTCLLLNEPVNAALAWAVAVDGLTAKHGFEKVSKSRFLVDLRILEQNLRGLSVLRDNFNRLNTDASTIFSTTPNQVKSSLVNVTLTRLQHAPVQTVAPARLHVNIQVAEGFLMQPLIAANSWPLQYDPFFRAEQTVMLQQTVRRGGSVDMHSIHSTGLGGAKKLDFVTKQSVEWLVQTVREGLQFHGVNFKEAAGGFMVIFERVYNSITSIQASNISIRKVSLKANFGFVVGNALYLTRTHGSTSAMQQVSTDARTQLVELLRQYCEQCELALTGKAVRPDHPTVPEVAGNALAEMDAESRDTYPKNHAELDQNAALVELHQDTVFVELPGSMPIHTADIYHHR